MDMDIFRPASLGPRGAAIWDAENPAEPRRALIVAEAARLADRADWLDQQLTQASPEPELMVEARLTGQALAKLLGQLMIADIRTSGAPNQAENGRAVIASIMGRHQGGGSTSAA